MLRVVIAVVVLLPIACSKKPNGSGAPAEAAPVAVTVAPPEKKTIRWTIEQPGSIMAYEVTPLVAKLPGYIGKIYVDIDDKVTGPRMNWIGQKKKSGTLLVDVTIPEIEQEYKQKEAMKELARHGVQLAEQNFIVAEASYKVAGQTVEEMKAGEKRAEANYQRWKGESLRVDDLVKRMVIDKQTGEETRNQYISADSSRDEAVARRTSSDATLVESQAKVKKADLEIKTALSRQAEAEADFHRLEALREYTQIRAPYDGVITARHLHTGHFLQPGNGRNEPILTIARIDPVRIAVDVPEAAADRVSRGTKATVRVQSLRGAEFAGTVARTSWALNPDVRTLRVEIDLPNPNGRIRPGMYAYASIPVELSDVLVVPNSAIFYQDELAFCYLAENGQAVKCQLQTGQRDKDNIEVLRKKKGKEEWSPLTERNMVIISHDGPITDGQKLTIK